MICGCEREQDVLDAATIGRWPDRADAELRAHVAGCAACADLAEVAPLLFDERDAAWQQADVPAASTVWWRAQMRARREAAAQAERPLVLVQRAAFACAAAALFGAGVVLGPWVRSSLGVALGYLHLLTPGGESLSALMNAATSAIPLTGVTIGVLLAPVVLYYALADR